MVSDALVEVNQQPVELRVPARVGLEKVEEIRIGGAWNRIPGSRNPERILQSSIALGVMNQDVAAGCRLIDVEKLPR